MILFLIFLFSGLDIIMSVMAANKMAKDVYEMGIKVLKNFVHVTRKIGKL